MDVNFVDLKNENNFLNRRVGDLEEKLKLRDEEISRLHRNMSLLLKSKYGAKSEVYRDPEDRPQQLELPIFNELEKEVSTPNQDHVETETITYNRKKKGRGKKKPFPEDLPREEVIIDLKDEEKFCPHDGTALKEIGEDVVEKLKTVPAQSSIVVEKRKKYVCPCCQEHIVQASSPTLLPKTIATPELLSFLVFSKFFQSLPLYRLEELYQLQKIYLSRGTMARWLIQVSRELMPIWNILEEKVLDCGYMAIDATPVQVLKEKGRSPQSKSSMWVRGSPEQGIVLFDYDVSGGGKVAARLIDGFQGAVQADAHRGYKAIETKDKLFLGCLMHARRRFYKAWVGGQKKSGLAEIGLKMIKKVYSYEKAYKDKGLTPEQRHLARQEQVAPYMEKIRKWCEKNKTKVLPKSPIGNATNYFLNEYKELSAFLKNGRYEPDNGWIERMIRKFAIGRNNWIFSDTVDGANASSLLYSLALTAKLNGKDPFVVMTEIFKKLPQAQTLKDYEELTKLLLKNQGGAESSGINPSINPVNSS